MLLAAKQDRKRYTGEMAKTTSQSITTAILRDIETRLGRPPRGLEGVALFSPSGEPMVIKVASLVEGKPFPNLYWLIDPELVYRIDCEEAGGLIHRLQQRVDEELELRESMVVDHRAFIEQRNNFMSEPVKAKLQELDYFQLLQQRGIGGIADFSRIRCLHTWYAAHLIEPNTIGELLDAHWLDIDRVEEDA